MWTKEFADPPARHPTLEQGINGGQVAGQPAHQLGNWTDVHLSGKESSARRARAEAWREVGTSTPVFSLNFRFSQGWRSGERTGKMAALRTEEVV